MSIIVEVTPYLTVTSLCPFYHLIVLLAMCVSGYLCFCVPCSYYKIISQMYITHYTACPYCTIFVKEVIFIPYSTLVNSACVFQYLPFHLNIFSISYKNCRFHFITPLSYLHFMIYKYYVRKLNRLYSEQRVC